MIASLLSTETPTFHEVKPREKVAGEGDNKLPILRIVSK